MGVNILTVADPQGQSEGEVTRGLLPRLIIYQKLMLWAGEPGAGLGSLSPQWNRQNVRCSPITWLEWPRQASGMCGFSDVRIAQLDHLRQGVSGRNKI